MRSFTAILLCQLDPVALNLVDSAYVNAVGADDFHCSLMSVMANHSFEHCCGVVTSVLSRQFLFGLDVDERFGELGKSGVRRFLLVKGRLEKPGRVG